MEELLNYAMEILDRNNVDYGDVHLGHYRWQNLFARNQIITNISNNKSNGIGIRVFNGGGWGFASTSILEKDAIEKTVFQAIDVANASALTIISELQFAPEEKHNIKWETPHEIDPFDVPIPEKTELLLEINSRLSMQRGIKQSTSTLNFACEHKLFLNTEGTYFDQKLIRVDAQYTATAVNSEGFESRTFQIKPMNIGYEYIRNAPFLENVQRIGDEALQKLKSPDCRARVSDLILLPSHTALTIHETIGHATELDRVMGWEADMAGTSFATTDKLYCLKYGSDIFNVVADRTMQAGRASVPIDDEGVKTSRWHLIKNGILSGYSTTRSTAHFIGETRSRGCSYADHWNSVPILRMPNISIEPGSKDSPSLEELIADTKDGILIDGTGSFSIDHQRLNFQFGGDAVWKIENGKIGSMVRRFTYYSNNPDFWNSVDAICNQDEWEQHGVVNCGKGQPMQRAQLTHGSAPLRLRNIQVGKARI